MPNGAHSDRRTLFIIVIPLIVINVVQLGSNAVLPALLARSPLLLIALNARNSNLILTAAAVDAIPFIIVAVARRFLEDPIYYLLGRRYGDRAVIWVDRRTGGRGWAPRLVHSRFRYVIYPLLFTSPGGLVCVAAGAIGMRVKTFLILDLAGAVAFVTLLRLFGIALAGPVTVLRVFFDRNIVWTTIGAAVLFGLYLLLHRLWRRRSAAPSSSLLDLAESSDASPAGIAEAELAPDDAQRTAPDDHHPDEAQEHADRSRSIHSRGLSQRDTEPGDDTSSG